MTNSDDRASKRRALWLGARVRLVDLRLRRISIELHTPTPHGRIDLSLEVKPTVSRVDQLAIYDLDYAVTALDIDGTDVFGGALSLSLIYELPEGSVSDEDLAAFGTVCVLFAAHPYLREILQSLTGRMGLPPLTLDLMQLPLDGLVNDD